MPNFAGFNIPAGAFIPPEILDILPEIHTLAELKVLLVSLFAACQPGTQTDALTIEQLKTATGLSRNAIIEARRKCVQRATITRDTSTGNNIYTLNIATTGGAKFAPPPQPVEVEEHTNTQDVGECKVCTLVVASTISTTQQQQHDNSILQMIQLGVHPSVAEKIRQKHQPTTIAAYIKFTTDTAKRRRIQNPAAFFVAAITQGWEIAVVTAPKKWYTPAEEALFATTHQSTTDEAHSD